MRAHWVRSSYRDYWNKQVRRNRRSCEPPSFSWGASRTKKPGAPALPIAARIPNRQDRRRRCGFQTFRYLFIPFGLLLDYFDHGMADRYTKGISKKDPLSALDVLQSMLEKGNSPLAQDFKRYRLKLDWALVVGETIAEKCSPVGFSNGIVYVWVVSSTWMNQLVLSCRNELLKKINTYGGKHWAKTIRFTLDRKDVPADAACSVDQRAGPGPASPNGDGEPPRDR